MDWFSRWIDIVAKVLAEFGVPEAYRTIVALGLFYVLATFLVLLVIFAVLRLARRRRFPPAEQPEESAGEPEEAEPPPETGPEEAEAPVGKGGEAETAPTEPRPAEPEGLSEGPVAAQQEEAPVPEVPEEAPPVSLFEKMRSGLAKTQAAVVGRLDALLSGGATIDEDILEELEEILVTADFGIQTTQGLIRALEERLSRGEAADPGALRAALREEIAHRLSLEAAPLDIDAARPFVIMMVGVNGVGKTTTIGKLAKQFADQGLKVVLGAGDTFRAAAVEQLQVWGERSGAEVIRQSAGSDPAAVAFDAAKAALARKADVLILDTAGRLHTKVNLMEELKKVRRVLDREIPGAPHENLLVLDATTGQNALAQARLFQEAVEVSGIALTKLDGTAKGGVVVAIGAELGIPVRYVGVGEGIDDLRPFDPEVFVDALFQRD